MAHNSALPPKVSVSSLIFNNKIINSLPCAVEDDPRYVSPKTTAGVIFSTNLQPIPVKSPSLVAFDQKALDLIGLSSSYDQTSPSHQDLTDYFSGNKIIPGAGYSAHCYAGHQFGSFSGQLGDGATMYIGEVVTSPTAPQRYELQFKGAGLTPYSRTADGRKVLRSSIREFLGCKFLDSLNIPTTLSPTLVTSQTRIMRDKYYDGKTSMEQATVITRLARTFLRFGSFEIFKPTDPKTRRKGPSVGDEVLANQLFEYTLAEYFPSIAASTSPDPDDKALVFISAVTESTMELVLKWQLSGFTHGVLNTDNMSILGLTIDYGPYGFMEYYDPDYTPNGSDSGSRYCYKAQPEICKWNVLNLCDSLECGGIILSRDKGREVVEKIWEAEYTKRYNAAMSSKLGLRETDSEIVGEFIKTMEVTRSDWTESFLALEHFAKYNGDSGALLATLDSLVQCCPSPKVLKTMLKTNSKKFAPQMDPNQLMALWEVAQNDPEKLAKHFNAPVQAIVKELRGEVAKFEKYRSILISVKEAEDMSVEDKAAGDRLTWRSFLSKYKASMARDDGEGDSRVAIMQRSNPRFILRNWILQAAISKAERGNYSAVRELVNVSEKVYDPTFEPVMKSEESVEDDGGGGGDDDGDDNSERGVVYLRQKDAPVWATGLYNT